MDFITSVQCEIKTKYRDMLDGKTPNPFSMEYSITSSHELSEKMSRYHSRIESEQEEYQAALSAIKRARDNRINRENAERKLAEEQAYAARRHKEYVREQACETVKEVSMTVGFLIPTIILVVIGLIIVFSPTNIFISIKYGWIIAIHIIGFLISLIVGIALLVKNSRYDYYDRSMFMRHIVHRAVLLIIGGVASLILMIVGCSTVTRHTIYLSDAEDFKLFSNLPLADSCYYVVTNDIDFNGESYGMGIFIQFRGTIDGGGHMLSNIKYVADTSANRFGITETNYGTIKNIMIKDSQFIYDGNSYNSSSGIIAIPYRDSNYNDRNEPVNCFVINSTVSFGGKVVEATVYGDAE